MKILVSPIKIWWFSGGNFFSGYINGMVEIYFL